MRIIIFSSIFLSVMLLMNVYMWRRFLRHVSYPKTKLLLLIPITLMCGDALFILELMTDKLPDTRLLYLFTSSSVGVTFILFSLSLFYDTNLSVSKRVPFDMARRNTIKILFDVTILIAGFSYLFRAFAQGVKFPEVNTVKVKIKDFPYQNLKLVQLSDVHVGRVIKQDFIESLVTRVNRLNPEIVVITGDLCDQSIPKIKRDLYPLSQIKAPTFFILGNHEYFHGAEEAINYLRYLGIKPLLNQHVVIGDKGKQFNLIGLNDVIGERIGIYPADAEQAYQQVDQTKPSIVLAHQPRLIKTVAEKRCDLMLSGHTHGGQIFPFGLLVMTAQPYLAGLYQHTDEQQIFVSRGTGYWGPPMRFMAPSEISQIIIQPS